GPSRRGTPRSCCGCRRRVLQCFPIRRCGANIAFVPPSAITARATATWICWSPKSCAWGENWRRKTQYPSIGLEGRHDRLTGHAWSGAEVCQGHACWAEPSAPKPAAEGASPALELL